MKTKVRLLATLRIWVVIYPSITLLLYYFGKDLACYPLLLRTFILTISLVPWMTFIAMPGLEYFIKMVSKRSSKKR